VAAGFLLAGPIIVVAGGTHDMRGDWRTASRDSAGIAPPPAQAQEAIVQVYAARAFSWRGIFAVHTWIATKPAGASRYQVHQVIGWRGRRGGSVVVSEPDIPDRAWFGAEPQLLADLRGAEAEAIIPKIVAAVAAYPYDRDYRLWPGPNSNTFTAFVGRAVPELRLELPVTAIGKDYLPNASLVGAAPSGSGYQLSVFGALGVLAAAEEGLELNVFGLAFGIDILRPALKLPGIGRLGMK
jgi:hypothetical protein